VKKTYTLDDVQSISEMVAFMYAGALQHPTLGTKKGIGLDLDSWNGHTGFVGHCTAYAVEINDWLNTRDDDFPGVLAYELIEQVGEWLLEEFIYPPDSAKVMVHFMEKYLKWIDQP